MQFRKSSLAEKKHNLFYVKWVVMPLVLLLFWIGASLWYINQTSDFTVLIHNHYKDEVHQQKSGELLAGDKIIGEFLAKDDNLGIVAVRFNTYFRINEDVVRFRVREKGKSWFYQNNYTTPQFQPNQLFTFGFPIQSDSDGKLYQFEIQSLQGESKNAVSLSRIEPIFVTKYQYQKSQIFSDNSYLLRFITKKFTNTFTNIDFLVSFISFAMPFFIYLTTIMFFEKYLAWKIYILVVPIAAMVVMTVFNMTRNDGAVIGITALWIYLLSIYEIESPFSFKLAFIFILFSSLLLIFGFTEQSKNLTMWGFMLLLGGVILQIIAEAGRKEQN